MAKASKTTVIIPATEVTEITLVLTMEEATTLALVGLVIAGDPKRSRRGDMEAISEALRPVIGDPYRLYTDRKKMNGVITFEDRVDKSA